MILITSPHPQFTSLAEETCNLSGIEAIIIETILEEAVDKIRDVADSKTIDVILSRGGTADWIKSKLEIPVITAEITEIDVLRSMVKASYIGQILGFLGFIEDQKLYDFSFMSKILKKEIIPFLYRNIPEMKKQISTACKKVDVLVVGSSIGAIECERLNLKYVLVTTSKVAMQQASDRIGEITTTLRYYKKNSSIIDSVINLFDQGVIVIDKNQQLIYANKKAYQILKLTASDLINKPLNMKIPKIKTLFLDMISRDIIPNKIKNYNNNKLIISSFPIIQQATTYGTLFIFNSIKSIQIAERQIRQELYSKGLIAEHTFDDIIHSSGAMTFLISVAKSYASTDFTILICGETGTGKEYLAQGIHNASKRAKGPFVAINCGELSDNLLESELFGYVEGSFTGAKRGGKIGLFELAHGGSLFLDEIDKTPLSLQVKLLRAVQEKKIRPVGSSQIIPIDVRVIVTTNKDLKQEVKEGKFLIDLYYRINVLNIEVPPLRERKEDIEVFFNHFFSKYSEDYNLELPKIGVSTLNYLYNYSWPGNIRELESMVLRLALLYDKNILTLDVKEKLRDHYYTVFKDFSTLDSDEYFITLKADRLINMEREITIKLLKYFCGNKSSTAKLLDISRNTLRKKLQ